MTNDNDLANHLSYKQLEQTNKRLLENNRILAEKLNAGERTSLQAFADWLKAVPKDTKINVASSEKTIVFIRQDL